MFEDTAITLGHDDAVTLARLLWDLEAWLTTTQDSVFEDLVGYFEPQARHGIWPARRRAEAARANLGRYWQHLYEAVEAAEHRTTRAGQA
jgi:hypothetical protein